MGPKPFITSYTGHRVTELYDSTCLVCSKRIAIGNCEADAIEFESKHVCEPSNLQLRFARLPTLASVHLASPTSKQKQR
jgi:hypothetical protein